MQLKSIQLLFLFILSSYSTILANTQSDTEFLDSILHLNYSQLSQNLYHSKKVHQEALAIATFNNAVSQQAEIYNTLGIIYHLLNKPEEAQQYFNQSILLFESNNNFSGAGNVYAEMGYTMKSRDLGKARTYMEKGLSLMEKSQSKKLAGAYDNYGVILHIEGKTDSALLYYTKSLLFKKRVNDSIGVPYSLQKIAMVNAEKGEVDQALNKLNQALEISMSLGDSLLICETLTYYGDIYGAEKSYQKSADAFEQALDIAQQNEYNYLINYIYNELPDIYQELGQKDKAYAFLKEGASIKDSVLNSERVRSIAELELFFESTQKEQKIQLLEQDVEIKNLRISRNRRVIIGIALFLVLLTALLLLMANRQKLKHKTALLLQREKLQKERLKSVIVAEEKERERVARELHDGLGQLLSAAKMHVSSLEEDVAAELKPYLNNSIQLVDQACSEVREISHALLPKKLNDGQIEIALKELAASINSSDKIQFQLKTKGDWSQLKGQEAVAIYRVLQELTNNTIKHANANLIQMTLQETNGKYVIQYIDNGKAFKKDQLTKGTGIGWQNIFSRIEMIQGAIDIRSIDGAFNAKISF